MASPFIMIWWNVLKRYGYVQTQFNIIVPIFLSHFSLKFHLILQFASKCNYFTIIPSLLLLELSYHIYFLIWFTYYTPESQIKVAWIKKRSPTREALDCWPNSPRQHFNEGQNGFYVWGNWIQMKSVSTRALGSRATCHLTDFNETLPV